MVVETQPWLFESLPAGQLCVVLRASHLLPLEYPDETARQVLSFLEAVQPPHTQHSGGGLSDCVVSGASDRTLSGDRRGATGRGPMGVLSDRDRWSVLVV